MINWFKFLRNNDKDFDKCITDIKIPDIPSVKPCKKEPDISEPVTSFLECFKQQPRRFKFVRTDNKYKYYGTQRYRFTDTKTSESWEVLYRPYYETTPHIEGVTWMTGDERELIFEVVAKYYGDRAEKLSKIRKDLYTAKINKERGRLTAIYKEG